MYLVVKGNLLIAEAETEEQARCIMETHKANSEKKGYLTTGYDVGKILLQEAIDRKGGWYQLETTVQFPNSEIITFVSDLFRK